MSSKKVLENLTNMAMAGILATDSTGRVLFGGSPSEPLYRKADLRQLLIEKRRGQDFPALLYEEPGIFWASFFDGDCYYLSGPVSTVHLDLLAQHRFYRKYNIPAPEERKLSYLPLNRYLSTVAVSAAVLEGNRELDVGRCLPGTGLPRPKRRRLPPKMRSCRTRSRRKGTTTPTGMRKSWRTTCRRGIWTAPWPTTR